ncbi:MAG: alanine racemase [Nitrospirae bacterium]|nr:alanine racemase [Nitrospirota bacterium]
MSFAFAHISLGAIKRNFKKASAIASGRPVLAVVKADAYGHGAIEASKTLVDAGAHGLAVAYPDEAVELRNAGIAKPIVLLFGCEPQSVCDIFKHSLTPVVWSIEQAKSLSAEAVRLGKSVNVHVKIDTGMGRVGILPDMAVKTVSEISSMPGVLVEGLMSHLSDADLADPDSAREQLAVFNRISAEIAGKGVNIRFRHLANSAAVLNLPETHLDMVRPGLMLYGYNPAPLVSNITLEPVMTVTARIVAMKRVPTGTTIGYGRTFRAERESLIATIAIGYADGFRRHLSNSGSVLYNGQRVPVVGRVCMDLTMIDMTDTRGVSVGDEVIVLGSSGSESIGADEMAGLAGTIPYEILTCFGRRVKRIYDS